MLLVTAEEMRALDRATIDGGHAPGVELMERAGAGVVEAMERRYGPVLGLRVLVLCGTGNNGGDGFVAARHLRARGASVAVCVLGDSSQIRGDARLQLERLEADGLRATPAAAEDSLRRIAASQDRWDFALDALLGTGARGVPEGLVAAGVQTLRELDDAGTRVIAVDLPTGVNADTGQIARRAVRADLTVTFGAPKRGHFLYPGRAFVGTLEVVDIGLLPLPEGTRALELATASEMAERVPRRDPRAHKGTAGRVLVVGGSVGLTGAVTLAARAATRAGAGYVRAAIPDSVNDVLEVKLTEEMTVPCAETQARALSVAALPRVLELARASQVVALGPGLSRDPEAADLARQLVAQAPCPVVIDADAINAFEGMADRLKAGKAPRVLTPHVGEMARLTGREGSEIESRRIDVAREWACAHASVLVLKGAPTVTASPDGAATLNPTGNPGMATAGMGDVLTGVIAALIAQGLAPFDAARLGAFVHGLAGDLAVETRGQHGLSAGDVLATVPQAMKRLVRLRDEALERSPR
jgi:ADP-dependent NAD(P)H-hydrate dehydratase / NAD(P)H-hydrate epimerase